MKTIFTLILFVIVAHHSRSQVVLNELYTDPNAGKNEFFELYNTSTSSTPFSVNNLTMVTYFHIGSSKGFYVMDLPNMTVASRGYFVGASANPFNYQGITNSTALDFCWNSSSFTSNQGSLKKWVQGTANLADGNLYYDQASLSATFNDFFYRITGTGASYSVFLYNNGQLVNSFIGGTGGMATVTNEIVNMPNLFVDMSGASPDFTINFSGYASLPVELCINEAGSDNGYIREFDGACGSWKKSAAGVNHTPRASNGTLIGINTGFVSVAVSTWMGNATTGSIVNNDIVSAPASYFPIDLQVFTDLGSTPGKLDGSDVFVKTNTENVVSDGPFYTHFTPYDANILIAVKTNAGCYDKILFIPNLIILSAKLTAFTANKSGDNINFSWNMENNEMAEKFELQKSTDGTNFNTVGMVFTSEKEGTAHYEYVDADPKTNVIYRLRIFNKGGKVEYSNTIRFITMVNDTRTLVLLNNPATTSLNFKLFSAGNDPAYVRVFDMSGRIVLQQNITISKGSNIVSLPLPSALQAGTYIVNLDQGNLRYSNKFIH